MAGRLTLRGGLFAAVGGPAVVKIIVMGLSGLLAILTSRLIIEHYGVEAYAQYGLLATLPMLLPFADLGIAAVVINSLADTKSPKTDDFVLRTIVTAFRILSVSGLIIISLAVIIHLLGLWPAILGQGLIPDGGGVAALICMAIFGCVLPLTVGQRIVVGLGRTTSQVAAQAVVAPFMLVSILTVVALSAPVGSFLAIFSFVGNALVSVICLAVAAKALSPQLRLAVGRIARFRRYPGVPIISLTWPVLVSSLVMPITLQTDRLLLSQLTHGDELARYNLAAQLFGLILQTIAAAGLAMWPWYAKARSQGRVSSPIVPSLWFLSGGLVLGLGMAFASPWLEVLVAKGKIHLDIWLVAGFVAFVAVEAAKYPLGMYMTDRKGLVFQVKPLLVMVPVNLGLSWSLIGVVGAGGPVLGSAIAVLLCQVIPYFWYVRRDLARRRNEQATEDLTEGSNA
ncbi:lipopolysaccharide biosynthesis protein [Arthrobacter oryzae]|jgi:O-antigen/teichoic acid export membrane protein|uniref:lipopolysaccharide biosynthesis protein n=1 Tax=Arthrobacter oryzae TaxID=409290 RepID=UPI0027810FCD|nr:polysaccharide biosynthesis protein [Arthrobacter oryzae]MDQ0078998.1 O-antigen/teichoic acid export membrane protein [Arthrobacter oryzae]